MNPEISVIMSVYNDEKFLRESIESILTQTFKNFEFIICNDCSTDNSEKIILEYSKKDSRIVYISNQNNMGLAASLNRCIRIARAPYIARMDSDDISTPNRLAREYYFLLKNKEYVVVGSHAKIINNDGNYIRDFLVKIGNISFNDCLKKSCIIHPSVLIEKKALLSVGMYSVNDLTRRAEDYDLWCKLTFAGFKVINIDDKLLYYREDLNSVKKRKYIYRIQEFKIKYMWNRNHKMLIKHLPYIIKPLVIGCIPKKVYMKVREKI